jgi:hypothetical protein
LTISHIIAMLGNFAKGEKVAAASGGTKLDGKLSSDLRSLACPAALGAQHCWSSATRSSDPLVRMAKGKI